MQADHLLPGAEVHQPHVLAPPAMRSVTRRVSVVDHYQFLVRSRLTSDSVFTARVVVTVDVDTTMAVARARALGGREGHRLT